MKNLDFGQILLVFMDFGENQIFPGVTTHAFLFLILSFNFVPIDKKILWPVFEKKPKNHDFGPILRVFKHFLGN